MSEVKGKLWSFLRDVLQQGASIDRDHTGPNATYEGYSARLDVAARERVDTLLRFTPPAVWSREKPTEPGFYWFRGKHLTWVCEVKNGPGGLEAEWGTDIQATDGEWSSLPLRPPMEEKG